MHVGTVTRVLRASFDPQMLATLAKTTGAFQRVQTIHPVDFLFALVEGCCTGAERSIANCRRIWERMTTQTIAESAFEDRFHAGTVRWLFELLDYVLRPSNRALRRTWPAPLRTLRDVLAVDGSRMALHDALAETLRSTTDGQAGLKVLGVLSLGDGRMHDARLGAAVHHDRRLYRVVPQRGVAQLLDLGFYDHDLFAEIDAAEGLFVSYLKANAIPRVAHVHTGIRAPKRAVGARLDGALEYGREVDVDCDFRRHDRDAPPTVRLRVVKVARPVEDRHGRPTGTWREQWMVTNLPRATWSPIMVAVLYRLRWAVERLWRSAKSGARLDQLKAQRLAVIFTFVAVSLLVQVVADRLAAELEVERGAGAVSRDRILATFLAWWSELARRIRAARAVRADDLAGFVRVLRHEGRHPNPSQPRVVARVFETLDREHRALTAATA